MKKGCFVKTSLVHENKKIFKAYYGNDENHYYVDCILLQHLEILNIKRMSMNFFSEYITFVYYDISFFLRIIYTRYISYHHILLRTLLLYMTSFIKPKSKIIFDVLLITSPILLLFCFVGVYIQVVFFLYFPFL